MKLYYSPGACSLSPRIILEELGLPYEAVRVDLKTHKTETGEDFYKINAKGYVPLLVADDAGQISEGIAIATYLGWQKPEKNMLVPDSAPASQRIEQLQWLTFVSTEMHKGIGTVAYAPINDEAKDVLRAKVLKRLEYVNDHLAGRDYLMGKDFNVVDAYLFTVLNWCQSGKIDLAKFPNITAYQQRVAQRPSVQRSLEKEGLAKAKAA